MRASPDNGTPALELVYLLCLLLLVGALAGFVAGLFGVGGGIVIVPALFYLFVNMDNPYGLSMALAVGTSLATIIPTASSSVRSHYRLGNIDWARVKWFAPGMVAAVLIAGQVVSDDRGEVLIVVFGALLLVMAALLFFNNKVKQASGFESLSANSSLSKYLSVLAAVVIGSVSVMAGVGGGALGVPALRASGLGIHRAIGTASTFGLMISIPGVLVLLLSEATPVDAPVGTLSLINFPAVLVLMSTTVISAPLGAKLNKKMNASVLQRIFAIFLVVVGVEMLVKVF